MRTDVEWKLFEVEAAAARRRPARLERLSYRTPGTTSVAAQVVEGEAPAVGPNSAAESQAAIAGLEAQLRQSASAAAAREQQLRREAGEAAERIRQQSERQAREEIDAAGRQVAGALGSFHAEREEYFARVEQEVVKLALAIAARILHREATLDPLLLAGAARVALGQLGATTGVRLRCPVDQAERWRELLGRHVDPAKMPEITGDAGIAAGDCTIEASVGTLDLGVRAQLAEIESGFFDLLEHRPGSGSGGGGRRGVDEAAR